MAPSTIPQLLDESVRRHPGTTAISTEDRHLDYSELLDQSRRFAAALIANGTGPGDRMAVWAPNSAEWIIAYLGAMMAGATLIPINTRFKGGEAGEILRRSRARLLVTVTDFLGTDYVGLLPGPAHLPDLSAIVVASGPATKPGVPWADFLASAARADLDEADRRRARPEAAGPADIIFTSGTTGSPKGVVMTHSATLAVGADWVAMTDLRAGDRYLMVNPYFHMFGLKGGILPCIAAGATMLPEATLDVGRVLARIESEQVTVLPGPPTLYQSVLDHPELRRRDLSSLRVAVTGSADIPVELIRRIHDELPFRVVISGYGLSEAGTATSTEPGDPFEAIANTVGRPRPGFELRIVGEAGDVPTGDVGEIVLRGPSVMSHYLDDHDATAAVLSSDGWLRTGDLGLVDGSGRLHIAGRIKDMFIVGGFNAYPAEIENILLRHPQVRQVAVIGVPDERLGEVAKAFVVAREGGVDADEIIAWSRANMANYKVPRSVEIVPELPVTASGKVQKEALRARISTT